MIWIGFHWNTFVHADKIVKKKRKQSICLSKVNAKKTTNKQTNKQKHNDLKMLQRKPDLVFGEPLIY